MARKPNNTQQVLVGNGGRYAQVAIASSRLAARYWCWWRTVSGGAVVRGTEKTKEKADAKWRSPAPVCW